MCESKLNYIMMVVSRSPTKILSYYLFHTISVGIFLYSACLEIYVCAILPIIYKQEHTSEMNTIVWVSKLRMRGY